MESELRKLFTESDVLTLMAELDEHRREFYDEVRKRGIMIALRDDRWWWYFPNPETHCLGGFPTFGAALWDGLRVYSMRNAQPPGGAV